MAHKHLKDSTVEDYVQLFESAEQATPESRREAEQARDYYDNKQWTASEVTELKRRNQRPVTINRVKPKVDFLLGLERQSRTDAKALPRTPQHDQDVDAVSSAIRYVADNNDFDSKRSDVWENLLIEGVGGIEVGVEKKGQRFEIVYKRYDFDRIFYDPHSRARDFSDAVYLGGVIWMDLADAKARWPKAKDVLDSAMSSSVAETDTYDDVPRVRWVDAKRKRIRVCLIYRNLPHYSWTYAWFTKSGFLKGPAVSPYYDYDQEGPCCPLIFTSAYVDRDGARYGYCKQLLDIQYEINRRRTRGLHLINQRQTYGNKQSGLDAAQVKRELTKADGHVEMQAGEFGKDFGLIPTRDMATGNLNMLAEAKAEIDQVGPSAMATGRDEREGLSGRAIIAGQQGAQTEIGPLLDALRAWQRRVYRATWNRVRQYWTGETWIRVTDEKNNLKWVGLNASQDEQGNPVEMQNDVARMDVDIILEDVPDTANVQQETFQMFTEAVRASGQPVPLQIWLELMPGFPNKEQVLEKLQPDEGQQQLQQQAQQLELAQKQAELAESQAVTAEKQASALHKQMQAMETRTQAIERFVNTLIAEQKAPSEIGLNQARAFNEWDNALRPGEQSSGDMVPPTNDGR